MDMMGIHKGDITVFFFYVIITFSQTFSLKTLGLLLNHLTCVLKLISLV